MTLFVHLLTVAAVIVHATMGCCAHESHSEESTGPVASASDCCGTGQACHGHAIHRHDVHDHAIHEHGEHSGKLHHLRDGCQSQQSGSHQCGHSSCNWFAPETRNSSTAQLLRFSENVLYRSSNLLAFGFVGGTGDSNVQADFTLPEGPVRLHLANSVLLI